jgi:site-specific recombinase XerD
MANGHAEASGFDNIPPETHRLSSRGPCSDVAIAADELRVLLDDPPARVDDDSEAVRARDDAVLELLYGSGLRVSELAGLGLGELADRAGLVDEQDVVALQRLRRLWGRSRDDLDLALGTYRRAVSTLIPEMTRIAWHLKKDELAKAQPAVTKRKFVYNLSRASYRKEWNEKFRKPHTFLARYRFDKFCLKPSSERTNETVKIWHSEALQGSFD